MKMLKFSNPEDFLALVVRRKWWILIPFLLLMSAISFAVFQLPDMYASNSLILVDPQDVPEEFVKDLVSEGAADRLRAILSTILSRTNLLRIIAQFRPQMEDIDEVSDEEGVERMRKNITVEFQEGVRSRGSLIASISISFRDRSPEVAQGITRRLAELFIEHDIRTRQEKVTGTSVFLAAELEKVTRELETVDEDLRRMKEQYRDELPEQLDSNQRALDRLEDRMVANNESMDRFLSHKFTLEQQLSQTPETITALALARAANGPNAEPDLLAEYLELRKNYQELRTRYTENHPEVITVKAQLERLEQQLPTEEIDRVDTQEIVQAPNPVYQSLQAQLSEVETEIAIRQKDLERIKTEISKYEWRVGNTARREQQMVAVSRRNDQLRTQYDGLKVKLDQAELAESLESKQKGAQFVVVDEANFPIRPVGPNRVMFILFALPFSLGAGLALAFAKDILNQKIWTQSEVEKLLGVRVLAEIPQYSTESELSKRRRKFRALAVTSLAGLSGATYLYIAYPQFWLSVREALNPIVDFIARYS